MERFAQILLIIILIAAGVIAFFYFSTGPDRNVENCVNDVARQIGFDQKLAGVVQPWETRRTVTIPDGSGWMIHVEITAYPAQGDPYTINYFCTVPRSGQPIRIGDWLE